LIKLLCPLQKFSFQAMENAWFRIAADRTVPDPKDPDHEDKLPKNTRAASAAGKASSTQNSTQDWSEDDSDEDCRMFICPTPLAYALPAMPSSVISDDEVVDAAPLNQGPPSIGGRADRKHGVKP
jgi:hypothetical protein